MAYSTCSYNSCSRSLLPLATKIQGLLIMNSFFHPGWIISQEASSFLQMFYNADQWSSYHCWWLRAKSWLCDVFRGVETFSFRITFFPEYSATSPIFWKPIFLVHKILGWAETTNPKTCDKNDVIMNDSPPPRSGLCPGASSWLQTPLKPTLILG